MTPDDRRRLGSGSGLLRRRRRGARRCATLAARGYGAPPRRGRRTSTCTCTRSSPTTREGYSPVPHRVGGAQGRASMRPGCATSTCSTGWRSSCDAGLVARAARRPSTSRRAPILKEFAGVDINSPGEPGVTYIMGAGFARAPAAGHAAGGRRCAGYRARRPASATWRWSARINAHLPRHRRRLRARRAAADAGRRGDGAAHHPRLREQGARGVRAPAGGSPRSGPACWAAPRQTRRSCWPIVPAFEEAVRARARQAGRARLRAAVAGDVPARWTSSSRWVLSCDAIPMITWLDGTSARREGRRARCWSA